MSAKKPALSGPNASRNGGLGSPRERVRPTPELQELLGQVFDYEWKNHRKQWGKEEYERRRFDFVFHMTDCMTDLETLRELFRHPKKDKMRDTLISLMSILIHVIPHLNAAGRLLVGEIGDPFAESSKPANLWEDE
jgi:hypothetical protein